MESDDENLREAMQERHELSNQKLPKKERKPFKWTPANTAQFKRMQEIRARNIKLKQSKNSTETNTVESKPTSIEPPKEEAITIKQEPEVKEAPKEIPKVVMEEPKEVKEEKVEQKHVPKFASNYTQEEDDAFEREFETYRKIKRQKRKIQKLLEEDSDDEFFQTKPTKGKQKTEKHVSYSEDVRPDPVDQWQNAPYQSPPPTIPQQAPGAPMMIRRPSSAYAFL